jgi:DNA-binding beta-propeller fold protein YncE
MSVGDPCMSDRSLRVQPSPLFPVTMAVVGFLSTLLGGPAVTKGAYPKVNLAVGYQVDPTWPEKPADWKWRYVTGVTVDAKDRVWVLNANDPPVQVYSADGKLVNSWGQGLFKAPHHITIDRDGNVWITDYRVHTVRKFSPKGELLLTLGTPDQPGADQTHFNMPTAAVVTPAGEVFVTDGYGNNRIMHFDAKGKFIKTWGKLGVEAGELSQPHSIGVDSKGRLYVGERNNCRIQVFDQDGKSLGQWRNLVNPWGIWITPADEVYVCGSSPARWSERGNLGNPPTNALVFKFNTDGRALELWTFPMAQPGKLIPGEIDWIHGLAVDSQGSLYLSDVADESPVHRVQKFVRLPAER